MEKIELGKRIGEETGNYLGLNLVLEPALEEENSRDIHTLTQANKQNSFHFFLAFAVSSLIDRLAGNALVMLLESVTIFSASSPPRLPHSSQASF